MTLAQIGLAVTLAGAYLVLGCLGVEMARSLPPRGAPQRKFLILSASVACFGASFGILSLATYLVSQTT